MSKAEWLEAFIEKYKPRIMYDVRLNINSRPDLQESEFSDAFDKLMVLVSASTSIPEVMFYLMDCVSESAVEERKINPCPQPDPLTM